MITSSISTGTTFYLLLFMYIEYRSYSRSGNILVFNFLQISDFVTFSLVELL